MGYIDRAGVEWTDASWDVVGGCLHVSPGCLNCYAEIDAATKQTASENPLYLGTTGWVRGRPRWNGKQTILAAGHSAWTFPLTWAGADHPVMGPGKPSLIFIGNMSDVFMEGRPPAVLERIADTIALSRHIGIFLTRRERRLADFFLRPRPPHWRERMWLGFSAERQQEFDQRWPALRELAADGWTTFVSIAPMLGPIVLPDDFLECRDRVWVIVSGEQGKGARYMDPDWARAVRDQSAEAGVPLFFKQMTKLKLPIPLDLFVREFPSIVGRHNAE